ncbi:MAG: molybdopterin oxidoreductase, partial [Hymenobacter sp.]|nr:molybdopterin oxidoreductase [Hymenobacter sp.]
MKYWKGIEELESAPEFMQSAFAEFMPVKESHESKDATSAPRRDFLKLMGFGVAAATLASCETPVRKAIPYLNKPEEIDPGISNFYASTYFTGADYNAVLVKSREGRPIKLEGNPGSPITQGGLSARAQAAVLNLYDGGRLQHFAIKKGNTHEKAEVAAFDREVRSKLAATTGRIAIVSPTIISPTTKRAIAEFAGRYANTTHVMYDAQSATGLLQANGGVVPGYDFSKANIIVSLGADFLGTWISPVEYGRQYAMTRKINRDKRSMSRHYQFETAMTLTGCNADVRVPVKPSEMGAVALALYNAVIGGGSSTYKNDKLTQAARDLTANRGASLVVSGSNDPAVQALVTAINQSLGSLGTTIDPNASSNVRQGDDARMAALVNDMNNGTVGAVIFYNANPVYNHPLATKVKSGIAKVPLTISLNDRLDETGVLCQYAAPDSHWLESWNDYEPKRGFLSLAQPVITPLFQTRQAQESLLRWAGNNTNYYKYLRTSWRALTPSDAAWDKVVHDGIATGTALPAAAPMMTAALSPAAAIGQINGAAKPAGNAVELALYEKVGIGTAGCEANNPFLQELPDPVSKATWGNYVAVPRAMAIANQWEQNDVVKVTANGYSVELPVLIQPGQTNGTVSIALGYGRTLAGKAGDQVGANAAPLAMVGPNGIMYNNVVTLTKTDATSPIAQTQTHHTLMDRKPVVQENTL